MAFKGRVGIGLRSINDVMDAIARTVDFIDKKGPRQSILRKGAAPVRTAVRSKTKVRKQPRTVRTLNLADGTTKQLGPGNLQKAMGTITFSRSKDVFVGPRFGKTAKKIRYDGYYYHMAYGTNSSKEDHVNNVLKPALSASLGIALNIVTREVTRRINGNARRNGLK